MMEFKKGDKVRPLTSDEYDKSSFEFRNAIEYNLEIWAMGHTSFIIQSIEECDFNCGCERAKRFGFKYRNMDSMCGMIYTKCYDWKKI